MKYLHVLTPYSGRPYEMIRFLKDNFPHDEHQFLVVSGRDWVIQNNNRLLAFPDLLFVPDFGRKLLAKWLLIRYYRKLFRETEHILWHSYATLKSISLLCAMATGCVLKKSVWVAMVPGYYGFPKYRRRWIGKLLNALSRKARKEVPYIGIPIASEEEWIRSLFGEQPKVFELPPPISPCHMCALHEELRQVRTTGAADKKVFLIGLDGLSYNYHQRILNRLEHLKESLFSVIMPMNFAMPYEYGVKGTLKYRSVTKAYGERVLQKNVAVIVRSSVPEEQYFRLLRTVDVAIFDVRHLANQDMLLYLLYMGKKVFLPGETALYRLLVERGVEVYDTEKIPEMSFEEVTAPLVHREIAPWLKERMTDAGIRPNWQRCFEEIDQEGEYVAQ